MTANRSLLCSILFLAGAACAPFKAATVYSPNVLQINSEPEFKVGALGDSITRGMSIQQLGVEDEPMNWSTGSQLPASHLNQIAAIFQQKNRAVRMTGENFAVSGETVLGTEFQIQAAKLAAAAPQYVTLEIGANDVCAGDLSSTSSVTAFRIGVENALQKLVSAPQLPGVIVVASIPNIWALTQISTLASNPNCQSVWQFVCPALANGKPAFQAQWQAANQALSDAAAAIGGSVVYDGGAVSQTAFNAADVSGNDCFHPSASGQAKLAALVWSVVQPKVSAYLNQNTP